MNLQELVARRDRVFGVGAPLFYETPVHLVRGEGVWVHDTDGRRYLDMYNNVPVVGHANARVAEAVATQMGTLQTHSRYLHEGIVTYAERLLDLHADHIESVVFACTGTEANEIAMLTARAVTGGDGFICTDATYHGHSALVGSLTRAPHRGRPGVHAFPFPQRLRPIETGLGDGELAERYLAEVRRAIDDFAAAGVGFAGMVICSLLANEGLPDVPAGVLARAGDMVRAAGGVVIADEVQSGFCRSGRWWGYEAVGLEPDLVTMGKPMGNGFPLAACAGRRELIEQFRARSRYFNTFGASPVHAAAGMAVLDELEQRGLREQVNDVGPYLAAQVRAVAGRHRSVGDVRDRGLFVAIEMVADGPGADPDRDRAVAVVNRLKDKGVLVSNAGAFGNVVKVRPPLVFERSHADYFLERFADTMAELT